MKRKRGGQPGNQNARKHGFYRGVLSPEEMGEFWQLVHTRNLDPEVAFLLLKLRSSLQKDPGNHRVKKDAANLLAKWYSVKLGFKREGSRLLKKAILDLYENSPVTEVGEAETKDFVQNESSVL